MAKTKFGYGMPQKESGMGGGKKFGYGGGGGPAPAAPAEVDEERIMAVLGGPNAVQAVSEVLQNLTGDEIEAWFAEYEAAPEEPEGEPEGTGFEQGLEEEDEEL